MGAHLFQADNGFLEGIVRGYRNSLLTQGTYNNLTQCENLEGEWRPSMMAEKAKDCLASAHLIGMPLSIGHGIDFRLQLSATDYGNFLANEPLPLSTAVIAEKVCLPHLQKWICVVAHLIYITQATQKLVSEFNYIRNNAVEPLAKFMEYIT